MTMIKRERYMKRIRPFIGNELIKVLTGIRRSGKSVMLDLIKDELREQGISESQCITFNFESLSNAKYCTANALYEELTQRISVVTGKCYLFFDEIQEVADWEKCINSARVDFDCDIYVTGSNAKLLSGELATYLGGRYVEFVIYPFSFEEYLESERQTRKDITISEEFKKYLDLGGMPFLTNLQADRAASLQYLRDVYSSVILKDVVKRNSIRDVDLLERIITFAMANVGHTFSARSISNYFKSENRKVAPETVLNYIKACCDAYLFFKISREDIMGKRILSVNEKYYIVDLPGYGFAKRSKTVQQQIQDMISSYILQREQLVNVFLLIDIRHDPQKIDREFMDWLGENGVPFSIVFTKVDKLGVVKARENVEKYLQSMLDTWEELPPYFVTSSEKKQGREELLSYINQII